MNYEYTDGFVCIRQATAVRKLFWRRLSTMKKIFSLALAVLMVFGLFTFTGCGKKDDDDKGAIIQMYLSAFPTNLDPTETAYGSADNAKLFGLLYEGLYTMNAKGELKKALADEVEYYVDPRDNTLKLEISLKTSRWSDGIIVDADDFVYAWQRLLSPSADHAAAALLYPIKNAKNVKEGLCSVNDLGVCAIKDNVIQIAFEKDFTNVEYFLRRLASPALVPLREDNASKFDDPDNIDYLWEASSTLGLPLTNGAFKYKKLSNKSIELERNLHYNNVSASEDNPVDKVVKPYQLITLLSEGSSADDQLERYQNKEIFYINLSEADESTIEKVGKVEQNDIPSVYTYFFDTTSELFSDARVRKALSIALDREHINSLTGRKTKAAEGIVPFGIDDTTEKTEFRKENGKQFVPTGDIEAAKALLAEAGVKKGSFTIEYNKERSYERDIAEYCKSVWKELGFTVKTDGKTALYMSKIVSGKTLTTGTNRIVGMDFQCTTSDAYSMLVGFSTKYNGSAVDLSVDEITYTSTSFTGFADEEYDAVCDEIVSAMNNDTRADAMHRAETMLIDKSPIIPLFCNVDVYASRDLSKIKSDMFGAWNFTKVSQKNYRNYLPEDETVPETENAEADAE